MSSPDKKALRAALALEGADQVWAVVRALRVFTLADLLQHTNANPGTTRDYLVRLRRGGHVALERPDAAPGHYRLVRDVGRERPRLRKDGSEAPQTSREKMWRTMKMLGVFHYRSVSHCQSAAASRAMWLSAPTVVSWCAAKARISHGAPGTRDARARRRSSGAAYLRFIVCDLAHSCSKPCNRV